MSKLKEGFAKFFRYLYLSYIPNSRDNIKQILIKILFLICFVTLIVSSSYITNYFLSADKQDNIIDDSRKIWHSEVNFQPEVEDEKVEVISEAEKLLLKENPDFKGWIRLSNTKIDNPIYQTTNNTYYLDHNQKRQKSVYGALYFDYKNKITEEESDMNLVIYGHKMKNGSRSKGREHRHALVSFHVRIICFSLLRSQENSSVLPT